MKKNLVLGVVIVLVIGSILWLQSLKPKPALTSGPKQTIVATSTDTIATSPVKPIKSSMQYLTAAQKAKKYQPGIELAGISSYHNLSPDKKTLTLKDLVGKKVILVDFWTYSCINCQRTLPYLTDWYKKYKDQGLEIIGVHTPEFDFEKDPTNVDMAIAKYGIRYPVVQDNDYGTWNAYGNRYWPHHYLIDIDGYIVDDHIGEGGYAETEMKIQELLAERSDRLNIVADVQKDLSKPVVEAAPTYAVSPETYFGSSRNEYLGNGVPGQTGTLDFTSWPSAESGDLKENKLYLSGTWMLNAENAVSKSRGGIMYAYHGQRVYFVARAGQPLTVELLRDLKPLTADEAGEDVIIGADGKSRVTINEARLYKLVKERAGDPGHVLNIIVPEAGLEAFTFTFG